MSFALYAHAQGNRINITAATANAAKDSFAVYYNDVTNVLRENEASSKADILPRSFEISKEVIVAMAAQLANQGENEKLQARLGIMFDANNKPFVTLIFETKNTETQSSTFFDFSRPCPPVCAD
jgi:hypothetical protein